MEVFPTIEIIDRTYAPEDQQVRFAIPAEITVQDIEPALRGKFVTRVIYLEDPRRALPMRNNNGQPWFDVGPGRDPLVAADELGRPVAIVRMGGRVPDQGADPNFYFGSPAWVAYPPRTVLESKPSARLPCSSRPCPWRRSPSYGPSEQQANIDAGLAVGDHRAGHVGPLLLPRSRCARA